MPDVSSKYPDDSPHHLRSCRATRGRQLWIVGNPEREEVAPHLSNACVEWMRAEWNRIALETSFLRGDPTNDKAVDGLRKFSLRPLHGILKRAERIRQTGFDFGKCRFKSVVRISRDQQLVVARRCACTLETFWHPFTGLHLVTLKWSTLVFESLQQVLRNPMLVSLATSIFWRNTIPPGPPFTRRPMSGQHQRFGRLGERALRADVRYKYTGRATGYSLWEFEVYPALPPTPAIAQVGTNAVVSGLLR